MRKCVGEKYSSFMRKHWWDFFCLFSPIFVSKNFIRQKSLNYANTYLAPGWATT